MIFSIGNYSKKINHAVFNCNSVLIILKNFKNKKRASPNNENALIINSITTLLLNSF